MTVTLVGVGAPVAATAAAPQTAVAPTPTGMANGHRVYVMSTTEPSGTAPSLSADGANWALLNSSAPGGTVRLTVWWRDKDASWSTMPTVSNAAGTSATNAMIVGSAAFSTDGTWVTPSASDYTTGSDTTSGTAFSATGAATLDATVGEYLFALCGTSGNTTMTGHALSLPGATLTSPAELADLGTANGGAVGFKLIGAPVGSGTGTGAPTVSGTLSGSNAGPAYFIRVRDQAATGGTDYAAPVVEHEGSYTSTSGNMTADPVTIPLGGTADAGQLCVITFAGDKNTGTLTVTDNTGTGTWVVEVSIPGASVSIYIAYKVAGGGETSVTANMGTAPISGVSGWGAILHQEGSHAWGVCAKSAPAYSDTAVSSRSTGTTGAATYRGLAVAVCGVDSSSNATAGTWSNSYVSEFAPSNVGDTGGAPAFTATAAIEKGATTETTFTRTAGASSDQMTAAVVVFGRQGQAAATTDTTDFFLAAA